MNRRLVIAVTCVPMPPFFLALPLRQMWLPLIGPVPVNSQILAINHFPSKGTEKVAIQRPLASSFSVILDILPMALAWPDREARRWHECRSLLRLMSGWTLRVEFALQTLIGVGARVPFWDGPLPALWRIEKVNGFNFMKLNHGLLALVLAMLAMPAVAAEAEWLTDVHAALEKAGLEHKVVLLDFTGSDWCPWCIKLKNEVFNTPEFAAFAKENLVLVEVDFPRAKALSAAQQEANNALARHYNIRGYPTVVLINTLSQQVGQAGYMPGGPKNFIAALEKIPGIHHVDAAVAAADSRPEPHKPAPDYRPIPPTAPNVYGELALKGISIAPNNRLAMINNVTLAAGESAQVKVKDGHVEVLCKEIRNDSALVIVNGTKVELKLGKN